MLAGLNRPVAAKPVGIMLEFAIRITVGGALTAVVCAVLWALFFTYALPWLGHADYTPAAFVLGISPGIILGQKGLTW